MYLGDTARVPYGSRSPQVITRYAQNNARFLAQFDLKLLVVACNTVSATALPALTASLSMPVLGMVEPGVAAALAGSPSHVGIIGTAGTIRSGAYQTALRARAPEVQFSTAVCPLFVPLAEEGWVSGEVPLAIARRYLTGLERAGVDTLVLACTTTAILRAAIAHAMGRAVALVDSAEAERQRGGRAAARARPLERRRGGERAVLRDRSL